MKEGTPQPATVETRRLAAIMFTDMVGFSRQMGTDEARMLRLLAVHNQVIQQAVAEHHGLVIKTIGDAFLVDFPSVVHAVQCAQRIQNQFRAHNATQEPSEQIHVRIGIHLGDIVQREGDVFGDGVNIASRLQALAEADTICISDMVHRDVAQKVPLGTVVSLGRPKLKNITQRFLVYALLPEKPKGLRQHLQVQRLKLSRRVGTAHLARAALVVVGLLIGGGIVALLFPSLSPFRIPQSSIRNQEAQPPLLPLPDKPSIVVLPFDNMSKDPEQDYFSNGITEVLTSDLSRISGLFVIARNTAFTYKGKATNVQDVGKELGVRYVLEGSVQKANDQVRIVTQLVDTTTGGHIWSERYDRPLKDIFTLQDEIVQKIVTTLRLQLTAWEQGYLVRKRTDNLDAYDSLLRGAEYFGRALKETKKEANLQAQQMYEKAIELDSTYAEAYAYLGWSYWLDLYLGWSSNPAQTLEQELELAQKAIALDDSLAAAYRLLGQVYLARKQYEQAIAEVKRAIAFDPNWTNAYMELGAILAFAGRPEEGIEFIETARRLNPREPLLYHNAIGLAYVVAEQYEHAIAPLKKAVAFSSNYLPAHVNLALCYAELGRKEEAQAEAAEILRLNPNFSLEAWSQRIPYKDPAIVKRHVAALRKAGLK